MSTHTIPHTPTPRPTNAGEKVAASATELERLDVLLGTLAAFQAGQAFEGKGGSMKQGVILDEETVISTTADRALRAAAQAGDRSQFETLAGQAQIRPEAVARAWDTYTAPPVPAAADPAVRAVRYASLRGLPAAPVPPWAGYPLRADLALPVSRAPAA